MPAISSSATTTTARLQQLLPQLFQPDTEACDRYLKVNIAPDTPALIALDQVQEAAQIPIHTVTRPAEFAPLHPGGNELPQPGSLRGGSGSGAAVTPIHSSSPDLPPW